MMKRERGKKVEKEKGERGSRPPITRPEKKSGRTVCLFEGIGNCGCFFIFLCSRRREIMPLMID
jgi:hypothetical protein